LGERSLNLLISSIPSRDLFQNPTRKNARGAMDVKKISDPRLS